MMFCMNITNRKKSKTIIHFNKEGRKKLNTYRKRNNFHSALTPLHNKFY